jgi:hypothetical protein
VRRPSLLQRLAHDVLHTHQYALHQDDGAIHEYCYRRWSGRLVGEKSTAPGDRPDFQRVGGAR